jgi:hypothetical protein
MSVRIVRLTWPNLNLRRKSLLRLTVEADGENTIAENSVTEDARRRVALVVVEADGQWTARAWGMGLHLPLGWSAYHPMTDYTDLFDDSLSECTIHLDKWIITAPT